MPDTPSRRSPRAPVRIVHLGLGAFHRAHQAWYTAHADPGHEWGIAAFTGRSPAAATALDRQDCVYTLVTRGSAENTTETIESIVAAHDGADTEALCDYLARAEVTVVTLTVTEKGYRRAAGGGLDLDDPEVSSDRSVLAAAFTADAPIVAPGALATMPGRLLWGLEARRRALPDATIALIPCDNIDDNGTALRTVLRDLANTVSPALGDWLEAQVDVVSTSVDRITPRTTAEEIDAAAARTGVRDEALVVTEPFHSWILSGQVRGERPRWEDAGAAFVSDIRPFERRKLWLLNGAHSSLAYEGLLRGHETVAEAIADPACAARVRELWDLDEALLAPAGPALDLPGYRDALMERFSNPAIAHRLRQIASDGSVKLRARAVDPLRRAREEGHDDTAARALVDAWARFVVAETRAGRTLDDVASAELTRRARASDPRLALIELLAPDLAAVA
ncbi:mannitol dehydrogenase family protein [Microbacterium paraoxydans]|uniref:mannitol dehydrogenase family protein n=1 Tax=Microbacterium paraoxydans TaxID=199592 RepID=UPI001CF97A2C|nr:mannitol dehydrogenase family protein [Microbacterium paraoxydans]